MNSLVDEIFGSPRSITFVLGTDTGVGKTRLMGFLAQSAPRPERIVLVKAVQTGVFGPEEQTGRDVLAYQGRGISPERIWEGYSFSLPIAPMTAAAAEGRSVDSSYLVGKIESFCLGDNHVLVEGTGGVLSPVFPDGSGILTLMKSLILPARVLLVSHPHLGSLSQVLSCTRILVEEGMGPMAIVLCHRPGVSDEATRRNPETLRSLLPSIPVLSL